MLSLCGAYIIVYINKLWRGDNLQNNQAEVLNKITVVLRPSTAN